MAPADDNDPLFWSPNDDQDSGDPVTPDQEKLRVLTSEPQVAAPESKAAAPIQEAALQPEVAAQQWITAPWETAWVNSIAFCMIIKNEHAEDVREFLQYHRCGACHALG